MIAPEVIDALVARVNAEATDFTCDFFRDGDKLRAGKWCSVVDFSATWSVASRGEPGSASMYDAVWNVEFACASEWERSTPQSAARSALEVARTVAAAVLKADNLGLDSVVAVTASGLRTDEDFSDSKHFCLRLPVQVKVYDRFLV